MSDGENLMPKVSVIIPCYNVEDYIGECLDSVFSQTFQNFEVIIINDGSTDKSEEKIRPYLNKYKKKIKYFFQRNRGAYCARNMGIKHASGEYIAFLDADDMLRPESLERRVEEIEADRRVGLVYTDAYLLIDEGESKKIHEKTYREFFEITFYKGEVTLQILERNFVPTPTVLVRSEVLRKVGLFDETFKRTADYDLWIRISKNGWKFSYVEEPLSYYRVREKSLSQNKEALWEALVNVYRKTLDHYSLNREEKEIAVKALARVSVWRGDYRAARYFLFKALKYKPLSFKRHLVFIALLIAPQVLRRRYIKLLEKKDLLRK
jgi:glycosyltransferase involved in cell wall biosynthesis